MLGGGCEQNSGPRGEELLRRVLLCSASEPAESAAAWKPSSVFEHQRGDVWAMTARTAQDYLSDERYCCSRR